MRTGTTLVGELALLLALFLTINRWRQEDVMVQFDFNVAQWLLVKFDRLGIIELMLGNCGRLFTARNLRWRANGPMERYFRLNLIGGFFADPFDGEQDALLLLSGSPSIDGVKQLRLRLEDSRASSIRCWLATPP